MSSNVINQMPYLISSRNFPEDIRTLTVELNKSYLDTANAINSRTIGLFPTNRPAITGDRYFVFQNRQQQSLRQVYTFGLIIPGTSISIPYKLNGFDQFTRIYGTCNTGFPDSRPIPYASVAANANIDVRIDTVNFNIIIALGAASPPILKGLIIIEWLSDP